jgi:hypothetical protein
MPSVSNTHSATGPGANTIDAGAGNNLRNFTVKVATPGAVNDCTVALETSPDMSAWTEMARATGPNWSIARSDLLRRGARANVVSLGSAAGRSDAGDGTTNGSAVVTDAATTAYDVGKSVTGTGIPAGTVIVSVIPGVSFTMSNAATATGTVTVTVGPLTIASVINATP